MISFCYHNDIVRISLGYHSEDVSSSFLFVLFLSLEHDVRICRRAARWSEARPCACAIRTADNREQL